MDEHADDIAAEGELYRLQEYANLTLTQFQAADKFISSVIAEQGFGQVAKKMADVIRLNCGNEAAGTFTITRQQLLECYNEMRKIYFNETLERLVYQNMVKLSLDREGNVCFDLVDAPWSELLKHKQKGGKGEPKEP